MWGDSPPINTGRERAIETLIDSEPDGVSYRAARMLDETVPNALSNRPNLVTRSALVEQAHSMAKHEIDTAQKYQESNGLSLPKAPSEESKESKERVLRHFTKIETVKRGLSSTPNQGGLSAAPPPQLVAALRKLYGSCDDAESTDSSVLPSLLRGVMNHKVFTGLDETASTATKKEQSDGNKTNDDANIPMSAANLETIVGNLCRGLEKGDETLQGMLIASLSVLTASTGERGVDDGDRELSEGKAQARKPTESDSSVLVSSIDHEMPLLQVGAVLSLMRSTPDDQLGTIFPQDVGLLEYFGKAAAAYEERIEIQKTRLMERMQAQEKLKKSGSDDGDAEKSVETDAAPVGQIPIVPLTPTGDSNQEADVAIIEGEDGNDDDRQDQINLPSDEAALSAAVFDRIISAVTGDDESLVGVDRAALRLAHGELDDSSESEGTNSDADNDSDAVPYESQNEDDPHSLQNEINEDSSSSEVSAQQSDTNANVVIDEVGAESDEEEDDSMLREALALSLADHDTASNAGDTSESQKEADDDQLSSANNKDVTEQKEDQSETTTSPLPQVPQPPSRYPYASSASSDSVDGPQEDKPDLFRFFDPAALTKFGSVPASNVIFHLFRHVLSVCFALFDENEPSVENSTAPKVKRLPVPGGMGSSLFRSSVSVSPEEEESDTAIANFEVTLQLLVASLLLLIENREVAMEGLRQAILAEQRSAHEESEIPDTEGNEEDGTPLSGEEDDPALALAMNYASEDNIAGHPPRDSLETKGMTRKAAAAAHDAALHLKSLRRKTNEWKERVKLFSVCALLSMKSFRLYIQSVVARWLRSGSSSVGSRVSSSLLAAHKVLPPAVRKRLSSVFTILLSTAAPGSPLESLVSEDSEDVDDVSSSFALHREAMSSWAESIPILFPHVGGRENFLCSMLKDYFQEPRSTSSSFPISEEVVREKVELLCRRFRVSDLLDGLVARPVCFSSEGTPQALSPNSEEDDTSVNRSVLKVLSLACDSERGSSFKEMTSLYLALCHRSISRGILWDGLYEYSYFDAEETGLSLSANALSGIEPYRISAHPSNGLQFDSSKCSDSIAILSNHSDASSTPNGSSAHQRASKVWGTVLSSTFFNPKTGVHRWAVRLDRCERGHVFVGVATGQASMRTYVGGDKFGWGVIGTQALWHDRRKIRGDYGATFRTGSIIIVTLDTDAGTLSFSSWKDSNNSSASYSLDTLLPSMASPRRGASLGSGSVNDWGIAFEGLPLDARLYPAVGLYQRDDRVTLLAVECGGRSRGAGGGVDRDSLLGGMGYYPKGGFVSETEAFGQVGRIRAHNSLVSWDAVNFVLHTLQRMADLHQKGESDLYLTTIIPSLAAAICLMPTCIPILSQRFALALLPRLADCIKLLKGPVEGHETLFPANIREGKWVIRATGSSTNTSMNECEEYVVDFSKTSQPEGKRMGFQGSGFGTTGKSKNGLVNIIGATLGSTVVFVEDWTDGCEEGSSGANSDEASSSCVVSARLNLSGSKFEGMYRNVQYGTTGHIAGVLCDADAKHDVDRLVKPQLASQALLSLALGHLATMVSLDAAGDQLFATYKPGSFRGTADEWEVRCQELRSLLSACPLYVGMTADEQPSINEAVSSIRRDYFESSENAATPDLPNLNDDIVGITYSNSDTSSFKEVLALVKEADTGMVSTSGGRGSLSALCREDFDRARQSIICVLLRFLQLDLKQSLADPEITDIWRIARRVVEDRVRVTISTQRSVGLSMKDQCREQCEVILDISSLLAGLQPYTEGTAMKASVMGWIESFYMKIRGKWETDFARGEFRTATCRGLLRVYGLKHVQRLICDNANNLGDRLNSVSIENVVVSLPRLLGRSKLRDGPGDLTGGVAEGIGGHYLSGLVGASASCKRTITNQVESVFSGLGHLLDGHSKDHTNPEDWSSHSWLLSVLPLFCSSISSQDVGGIVLKSETLAILPRLMGRFRRALPVVKISQPESFADNKGLVASEIRKIVVRDLSRVVLHTSISIANVVSFQLTRFAEDGADENIRRALKTCVEMLVNELGAVVPEFEQVLASNAAAYSREISDKLYAKWFEHTVANSKTKPATQCICGISGLSHLLERGTLTLSFGSSFASPKGVPSASQSGQDVPASHAENLIATFGIPSQHYLTQCLHLLCCVVKSREALDHFVSNEKWKSVIYTALGLEETGDGDMVLRESQKTCLLPSRFRARILRLLSNVMAETTASLYVVRGLFRLAGGARPDTGNPLNDDAGEVSQEAVTLLRRLHSLPTPNWRDAIHGAIAQNKSDGELPTFDDLVTVGILSFVSGSIRSLRRGSYVLLKPQAAASLSSEGQSFLGKSHGSGSSNGSGLSPGLMPHNVVGNGTEGIVAGLCRSESSAGIVSRIDVKSGMCEVVLIDRLRSDQDKSPPKALASLEAGHDGDHSRTSRFGLTVRALRTPLADVAQAQEAPLCLDATFPAKGLLSEFLVAALAKLKDRFVSGTRTSADIEEESSGVQHDLHISLQLLRTTIVLLSEGGLWAEFQGHESCHEILRDLLRIAANGSTGVGTHENASVSLLPSHEGRYNQLQDILTELRLQQHVFESTLDSEWMDRKGQICFDNVVSSSKEKSEKPANETGRSSGGTTAADETPSVNSSTRDSGNQPTGSRGDGSAPPPASQSAGATGTEDDEESEAAATAAAHLREAAIAQMAELGLPRSWSELALRRTGGTNIEAAVHFCLERGGDMERLIAEERERERMMHRQSSGGSSRRRGNRDTGSSNHLLRQLLEMGFPSRWCAEALAATRNNVDEALTWILTNGERLSAEDEGMEEEEDDDEDEDDPDEDLDEEDSAEDEEEDQGTDINNNTQNDGEEADTPNVDDSTPDDDAKEKAQASSDESRNQSDADTPAETNATASPCGWRESVTPLRFISGRSIINPKTLSISGLPTGGFSSVGTKGVLLTSGKWYYEAILETAGCLQIGWADGSFSGHCHADRGDGCGDGPSSWAYDGWRRYRWHASATEWGCRWKEGDVVGCLVDMDNKIVSFTLNGKGEEIGMGVAFSGIGFRPCGGVYACVSFNRREKLRLILGGKGSSPFCFGPPEGYRGVGEAVIQAVDEYKSLLQKESVLESAHSTSTPGDDKGGDRRFLCDFSDGEHGYELFAWQHRYYGSDASVHLGSGRSSSKQSSSSQKGIISNGSPPDPSDCVGRLLEKQWSQPKTEQTDDGFIQKCKSSMSVGLNGISKQVTNRMLDEGLTLAVLYSRKLTLHLAVTLGESFSLDLFTPASGASNTLDEEKVAHEFWDILDESISLRAAGWVGEAGAMAIAAEALGLGISSNEHQSRQQRPDRLGVASLNLANHTTLIPVGGISQMLSAVSATPCPGGPDAGRQNTSRTMAACAEASMGVDGGVGPLVFVMRGLQGAASKSKHFREILLAAIRRSVRLLAVVDYSGDDSAADEDEEGEASGGKGNRGDTKSSDQVATYQPDARLTCFLTGLLLSKPVHGNMNDRIHMFESLLEAWSVGLLSASAPWRMVCALTASGILNMCPLALKGIVQGSPTLAKFYSRLHSTVSRRIWAERAAVPVCSRYIQSMVELLSSVKRASTAPMYGGLCVDAATPIPLDDSVLVQKDPKTSVQPEEYEEYAESWEPLEGWVSSDAGWEVWTGSVEFMVTDWKTPSRSPVRTLMDGGEGPPMLREGCTVMRGLDWETRRDGSKVSDEDGKSKYELEKAAREKEKKAMEDEGNEETGDSSPSKGDQQDPAAEGSNEADVASPEESSENPGTQDKATAQKKKKRKKIPSPKLPIGTVISIEPWNGIPAMARKVKWHLTGKEGIYRYGGDGGRFDISHVEVNEKSTRVRKRHPLPESAEQCASRHGFGSGRKYSMIFRLRCCGKRKDVDGEQQWQHEGVLEYPDFGAGVRVKCTIFSDGAVSLTEKDLLFGSRDSGWEARFGQPSFVPGTVIVLSPTGSNSLKDQADNDARSSFLSLFQELMGSSSYTAENLRNRADGSRVRITSEMRLLRGRQPPANSSTPPGQMLPPRAPAPISFDRDYHASSLSLSRDGRTVACNSPDGRGTAFASVGFTKGVHYWEVKLEQADIGSVFIGVAEKPSGSGSGGSSFGHDSPPRLNRWLGWGFVNFRATYTAGAERVYGAHCHNEDTVGVLLDCDAGRLSFFYDGLKYGEHILNDLGCAFENVSPFGFNADGCGSGGAGQGAPSGIEGGRSGRYPAHGIVRPRALWPVVGLRNPGDRVTLSTKWMTSHGVDGATHLRNIIAVDDILVHYCGTDPSRGGAIRNEYPNWFVKEAFQEYKRWHSRRWYRSVTRGSSPHRLASFGLDVDLDTSDLACAAACAALGLRFALLAGDRVSVKRSAGRPLELAEEAVVLGAHQGRLFYRIVSQKSEGGSLTEGGGRAWFWDESEVVDGGLELMEQGKGAGVDLPLMDRFRCLSTGGLRIVYEGGAVVRSDLEIFDRSATIGTIPCDTVIPLEDVLERRVNSCGVVRFRVRYDSIGPGWISSRIRGGKEEAIVEPVHETTKGQTPSEDSLRFPTPEESAMAWLKEFQEKSKGNSEPRSLPGIGEDWDIHDLEEFELVLSQAEFSPSLIESDSVVASLVSAIADFSESGDAIDCDFVETASAVLYALDTARGTPTNEQVSDAINVGANQAAAAMLADRHGPMPPPKAVLARIALVRALNRRVRFALPWLMLRPSQEGSAILGGLCGHGASVDRAGRSRLFDSEKLWVQVPSIASRIRTCRKVFFSSVKVAFFESVTNATTTPTPLSHDEYELPREIRTVRVNRLKARRAMAGDDFRAKRKHSVFAQLLNETRSWGGAALRRGFVAKGHGGQKRAFKVKLVGEGVNDYSGPYREVFTDAINEIVQVEEKGDHGSLGVLDPTPNNSSQVGNDRGLFIFSTGERGHNRMNVEFGGMPEEERRIKQTFASLMTVRDESTREAEESLLFLGRLVGTARRHGIPVDLPLPMHVAWNAIVEDNRDAENAMLEIDLLGSKQVVSHQPPGILVWQQRMLNSFVDGLSNVIPVEILPLLTGTELRDVLCGHSDVDVDLLRRVVEYEGYQESDAVISFFWDALREMSSDNRKKFLQFVWARSRLPLKESDFDAPFKIQKDTKEKSDTALPSASTCFFTLTLPEYSTKEMLKEKLLFAVDNVCTMESDYVTNDAEVGEGWRGL